MPFFILKTPNERPLKADTRLGYLLSCQIVKEPCHCEPVRFSGEAIQSEAGRPSTPRFIVYPKTTR